MVNAPFVTRLVFAMGRSGYRRTAHLVAEPSIANQIQEKWMKLVKSLAIAFAVSAMLAGPVLAQGGSSGSGDEEFNAQPGVPGEKAGVNARAGAKGTVGAGSGPHKSTSGAVSDPATGGKRY